MASKEVWDNYRKPSDHNVGTNEDVLSMLKDVVEVSKRIKVMYGEDMLILNGLTLEWIGLSNIARMRGLNKEVNELAIEFRGSW